MVTCPWIRIVIVTFNSGHNTQDCIDALTLQTDRDFEVVVLDNVSTDGWIDTLKLPDGRFTLVKSQTNSGFSGGSNLGLTGAQTPYVMTLNPDAELAPTCLAVLREATQLYPQTAMFSPILFNAQDGEHLDGAGDSLSIFGLGWRNGGDRRAADALANVNWPCEVFSPTGAAAIYKRDEFEEAGGFDAQFFCYLEDLDLGLRLRARGHKCLLIQGANGVHFGGHSSDKIPGFALEQSVRNGPALIVKSAPLFLMPIMLSCHLAAHLWFQYRNRNTPQAEIRKRGFRKALCDLPRVIGSRFRRRAYPLGASYRVAKQLSWSLKDVKSRRLRILNERP